MSKEIYAISTYEDELFNLGFKRTLDNSDEEFPNEAQYTKELNIQNIPIKIKISLDGIAINNCVTGMFLRTMNTVKKTLNKSIINHMKYKYGIRLPKTNTYI
jgi:hypothetical protein